MSITNSSLFKEYARPVINPERNTETLSSWVFGLFDNIADSMLRRFVCQYNFVASRFAISEADETTFSVLIEGCIFKKTVWSQTIGPSDVALMWGDETVGNVHLPQVQLISLSTPVVLEKQQVNVVNFGAYGRLLESLVRHDETLLHLSLIDCPIHTLGKTRHLDYQIPLQLEGLGGPQMEVVACSFSDDEVMIRVRLKNQGSVEIEHGLCTFDLRNGRNETIAVLTGVFDVVRGSKTFTLNGCLVPMEGVRETTVTRLVGVGLLAPDCRILSNETIKQFDILLLEG